MVGGGNGGNIGNSHRIGAQMDALAVLTAGCLTRNKEQNRIDCEAWGIPTDRAYDDYREMAEKESKRDDGIDFVTVVTPDNSHYDIVKCFLEHGINVVCEKPFTRNIAQAEELREIAKRNGCEVCVTYTYAHYPILRQCRKMIESGEIGKLVDVLERPASNIYVVKGETEHLIPAVPEFIMSTDAENGVITVRLIEGM